MKKATRLFLPCDPVNHRTRVCAVMLALASAGICSAAMFPYSTSFSSAEGFSVGPVIGQGGWNSPNDYTNYIVKDSGTGPQCASVGAGNGYTSWIKSPVITNSPETGKFWVEFAYKIGTENTLGDETIQVSSNSGNLVYLINITPEMVLSFNNTAAAGVSIARGQWYHYSVEVDNGVGGSLYVNGQKVADAAYGSSGQYGLGLGLLTFYGGDAAGGSWPSGDIYSYVGDVRMGAGVIPEPLSVTLLGLGLGAVMWRRRR